MAYSTVEIIPFSSVIRESESSSGLLSNSGMMGAVWDVERKEENGLIGE